MGRWGRVIPLGFEPGENAQAQVDAQREEYLADARIRAQAAGYTPVDGLVHFELVELGAGAPARITHHLRVAVAVAEAQSDQVAAWPRGEC